MMNVEIGEIINIGEMQVESSLFIYKSYKFDEVSDYMSGSFTTQDVAIDLNIKSNCYDLNCGFDLIDK